MSLLDTEMNQGFTCPVDVEVEIPNVVVEIPAIAAEMPNTSKKIPNCVELKLTVPGETPVVKKIPDYVEKKTDITEERPVVTERVLEVNTVMGAKLDTVEELLVTRQIVPDCVVELTIVGQQIRDCVAEIPVVGQQSSRCERKIPVVRQEVPDCAVRIPIVEQEMSDCVENILLAADRILSGPYGSSIVVERLQVISVGTNSVVDSSTSDLDEIPDVAGETRGLVDEIPAFADEIPDVINILRSHVDGLQSITRKLPTVVERLPDVYNPESLALDEEPRERTDDDTLLDFLRHASPYPAAEFLKRSRSFSQATLNVALILACERGFKYLVQKLVHLGADIECRDENGKTPLLTCVENHYFDMVRFLVAKGADVKAVDCAGNNALILSNSFAGSREMIQFLLEQACDTFNHQNKDGHTALMRALEVMDVCAANLLMNSYRSQRFNESTCSFENCWALFDQTVNCRGETAQQIAENCGLGDVFKLLKGFASKEKLKIQEGVYTCDHENLACWFNSEIEARKDCDEAILGVYRAMFESEELLFIKEEMASIRRFLQNVSDMNWEVGGYLTSSHVSIVVDAGDYNLVELLCQHGAPLNQSMHGSEKLPLSVAAKYGRVDLVELLLKYKADVNTRSFRNSPLDCALIHGHTDCAEFLVNHGANMDIKSAFLSAMKYQSSKYVQFLFRNYQSETVNCVLEEARNGNNLLVEAVQRGNLEIIEQILQAGIDVNETLLSGVTPIAESKNGAVAQFLIRCGADVNHATNVTNETPLMHVLIKLYRSGTDSRVKEVFRLLLENSASVNAKINDGTTPLMFAAGNIRSEVIMQMLLNHGADFSDQDIDGNTALLHAILENNSKNALIMIHNMKNNTGLLNLQNNQGLTALMSASSTGDSTIMSDLIDSGADVNTTDVNGDSALFHAIKSFSAKESHLKVLINAGCEVNHQNNEGLSPLMIAARRGCRDYAAILLNAGADVNAVSHKDSTKTAMSFVVFSERYYQPNIISLLHLLLDKGAKSSYSSSVLLSSLVTEQQPKLIPKVIQSGLGPIGVDIDVIPMGDHQRSLLPSVSPLCLALLVDNVTLARYFWRNLFLTNADVSSLPSNRIVRLFLQRKHYEECLSFLDEVFSQPMSLFKMCFVAVTSAVGASPGREARINKLPLPRVVKDMLLFKAGVKTLTKLEMENIERAYQLRKPHFFDYEWASDDGKRVIRYLDSDED